MQTIIVKYSDGETKSLELNDAVAAYEYTFILGLMNGCLKGDIIEVKMVNGVIK